MHGDAVGGISEIRDYPAPGEPTFNFTASSAALFGYTVTSSSTTDTDPSFIDNGVACNLGTNQLGRCWKEPTTSGFTIVDRGTAATNGATSTIQFKVNVPSGAVPVPQAQSYTATATLTLTEN